MTTGEVRSFSKSGLFLGTESVFFPGMEVELKFFLPDGTFVDALGEVRRVVVGACEKDSGIGIRFLRINCEALFAIEALTGSQFAAAA